jgi:hypothetical protein
MDTPAWRPQDEKATVSAEAVLLEWLAAIRGFVPGGPAGLRDWARHNPGEFRAAFSAFARIDPELAHSAAGWLLGAVVRPDDRVLWTGDTADPCLAGLAAIGGVLTDDPACATIRRDCPPVWPPAFRPPGANPDGP